MFEVRIGPEPFDIASVHARLSGIGPTVGAVVLFTGQVRDAPLHLDHYAGMAERQATMILKDARERWPLLGAIIVHRHGLLPVGEAIVLVGTACAHRADAFDAATFLMDYLKTRAPFWKRGADGWVDAKRSDEASARRWEKRR
jgi:molybdopterin synthase catalytic subunit